MSNFHAHCVHLSSKMNNSHAHCAHLSSKISNFHAHCAHLSSKMNTKLLLTSQLLNYLICSSSNQSRFVTKMRVNLLLFRVLKMIDIWSSLMLINSILRFLQKASWWIIIFMKIVIFWFWAFIWINMNCLNSSFELTMNVILCVNFKNVAFWNNFIIKSITFWNVFAMKVETNVFWILVVIWTTMKWFSSFSTLLSQSRISNLMINDSLNLFDDLWMKKKKRCWHSSTSIFFLTRTFQFLCWTWWFF